MSGNTRTSICEEGMGDCLAGITSGKCHHGTRFSATGDDVICLSANPDRCSDRNINESCLVGTPCAILSASQFSRSETGGTCSYGVSYKITKRKTFFNGKKGATSRIVSTVVCLGPCYCYCVSIHNRRLKTAAALAAILGQSSGTTPADPTSQ